MLAGAGSGKTRVIVHKIARLLEAGYAPSADRRDHVHQQGGRRDARAGARAGRRRAPRRKLAVSTFHSLGVRILREHGERLGLTPNFSILDSDDVLGVLKDAGGTHRQRAGAPLAVGDRRVEEPRPGVAGPPKPKCWRASTTDAAARGRDRRRARHAALRGAPRGVPGGRLRRPDRPAGAPARQRRRGARCVARAPALRPRRRVPGHERRPVRADEAARRRARPLHGGRRRRPEHLRLARRDGREPEAPARRLSDAEGHRAGAELPLDRQHPRRRQRGDRHTTRSCSRRSSGASSAPASRSRVVECDDEVARGRARAGARSSRCAVPARRCADIAILYRANHQARVFEQALRKAGIPYKVSGGQSFFDRAEIRDLCAWLRLIVNHDDDPAFLRAVTSPKRGIGHQTLAALGAFAGRWKSSLFEALVRRDARRRAAAARDRRAARVRPLRQRRCRSGRARRPAATPRRRLLLGWLKDIGYEEHLHEGEESPALATARWSQRARLRRLDRAPLRRQRLRRRPATRSERSSVLAVAQTISVIISLAERGDDQNVVTLSTLHAAKGLEWPHVILASVNEGPAAVRRRRRGGERGPARGGAPPDVRRHHARARDARGEHAAGAGSAAVGRKRRCRAASSPR